jgi:hypothetical protein
MRRPVLLVLAAALVAIAARVLPAPAASTSKHPDLGMARLSDVSLSRTGGRARLYFSATVVNVGQRDFMLHAERATTSSVFSVVQRIGADGGGTTEVPTTAQLAFGGDGHNHWHVKDLQHYELKRLDNGVKVGTSAKSRFCFFDNDAYRLSLPGAPQHRVHGGGGWGSTSSLTVDMGLSVGWGDTNPSTLPDQFIDVTGLTAGRYRLVATADPDGLFVEGSESNNVTWVDVQLNGSGPKSAEVVAYGPTA